MMKVLFMYYFLECFTITFSAFWWTENAISDHSSTGLIKSTILDILVLG